MGRDKHGMDQHRASQERRRVCRVFQKVAKVHFEMCGRARADEEEDCFSSQVISHMIYA